MKCCPAKKRVWNIWKQLKNTLWIQSEIEQFCDKIQKFKWKEFAPRKKKTNQLKVADFCDFWKNIIFDSIKIFQETKVLSRIVQDVQRKTLKTEEVEVEGI